MRHQYILAIFFVLALFSTTVARAEGCEEGQQRPPTAAEKTFYAKFTALRTAAPKPAAGWEYDQDSQEKMAPDYSYLPDYLCGTSNYYISVSLTYQRPMSQADSDKEMAAMQATPDPAKQKKVDALTAQEQAIMQKMMEAAQKQDYNGMTALGKQNDAIGKQLAAAQKDANSSSRATMEAIQADRSAKADISINNQGDYACYGSPKALKVAGATAAYSCAAPATFDSDGNQVDPARAEVMVVFGKYSVQSYDWERTAADGKQVKDSYVQMKPEWDDKAGMKVQNLGVDLEGDNQARAEALYKVTNLASLQKLLQH